VPYSILLIIIGALTYFNTDELKFPQKDIERIEKKYNMKIDSIQKLNTNKIKGLEDSLKTKKGNK